MIKGWGKQGFTVVEILIVVVVIGILATIVLVAYNGVRESGYDRGTQADINALADQIDLKTLDDQSTPPGGAVSSSTSGASTFPGVTFKSNKSVYATNVTNLYYCTGTIGGIQRYAIVGQSKTGKVYAYQSESGLKEYDYTLTTAFTGGPALCVSLGFSAPYTWSFGLNGTNGAWASWVTN